MTSHKNLKTVIILGICFFGFVLSVPNFLPSSHIQKLPTYLKKTVNLGLELQGGSHLQFEIDFKSVLHENLRYTLEELRKSLRKEHVGYIGLKVEKNEEESKTNLTFSLRSADDFPKVKKLIQKIDKDLLVEEDKDQIVILFSKNAIEERKQLIAEQLIEIIRRRIDESGVKEPLIQKQGKDRIIAQLPGTDNPSEMKKLIGKTAKLSFHIVDSSLPYKEKAFTVSNGKISYLPEMQRNGHVIYIPVNKEIMVDGGHLIDAQASFDHEGRAAVSLKLDAVGTRQFRDMSARHLKKQAAIVLDGKVISAPVLQAIIEDGRPQITGHFSVKEANELALLLRAGALPAPLKIIEERTVGPSLGFDSIYQGKKATILAFIFVSLSMLFVYRTLGIFASIALVFNIILLLAGLSLLQATLTLPGIAGIALTIGMAVDANVLIYERIKEELRAGFKPLAAVEVGYKRAMTSIIDSNLTTLIAAFILFEFGSGPIKGFAVTLSLGIIVSLFTALSLTRIMVVTWLNYKKRI
ncbi:MAG: protein translocase subunit SecD [Alphaproteobacteria bacterium]